MVVVVVVVVVVVIFCGGNSVLAKQGSRKVGPGGESDVMGIEPDTWGALFFVGLVTHTTNDEDARINDRHAYKHMIAHI